MPRLSTSTPTTRLTDTNQRTTSSGPAGAAYPRCCRNNVGRARGRGRGPPASPRVGGAARLRRLISRMSRTLSFCDESSGCDPTNLIPRDPTLSLSIASAEVGPSAFGPFSNALWSFDRLFRSAIVSPTPWRVEGLAGSIEAQRTLNFQVRRKGGVVNRTKRDDLILEIATQSTRRANHGRSPGMTIQPRRRWRVCSTRSLAKVAPRGLFLVALAASSGCGREFFRQWANQDVTEAVFEKSRDPRFRIDMFSIDPPAMSRFANPFDPDYPPAPPDDPAADALSPKPQIPKFQLLTPSEGTGYLEMLEGWRQERALERLIEEEQTKREEAEARARQEANAVQDESPTATPTPREAVAPDQPEATPLPIPTPPNGATAPEPTPGAILDNPPRALIDPDDPATSSNDAPIAVPVVGPADSRRVSSSHPASIAVFGLGDGILLPADRAMSLEDYERAVTDQRIAQIARMARSHSLPSNTNAGTLPTSDTATDAVVPASPSSSSPIQPRFDPTVRLSAASLETLDRLEPTPTGLPSATPVAPPAPLDPTIAQGSKTTMAPSVAPSSPRMVDPNAPFHTDSQPEPVAAAPAAHPASESDTAFQTAAVVDAVPAQAQPPAEDAATPESTPTPDAAAEPPSGATDPSLDTTPPNPDSPSEAQDRPPSQAEVEADPGDQRPRPPVNPLTALPQPLQDQEPQNLVDPEPATPGETLFDDHEILGLNADLKLYEIGPEEALTLALINSRAYQTQIEQIYLVSLGVTLQRFNLQPQFFANLGGGQGTAAGGLSGGPFQYTYRTTRTAGGQASNLSLGTAAGVGKVLSNGAQILGGIATSVVFNFNASNPRRPNVSSVLPIQFVIPLLRNGGKAVTLENLTQAERDLLAQVRDFTRFRQTFFNAVLAGGIGAAGAGGGDPTVGYLPILRQFVVTENTLRNVLELQRFAQQYEELAGGEASGLTQQNVDQVRIQLQQNRSQLISQTIALRNQLDQYKIQLGLPPDLPLTLDRKPIEGFVKVFRDIQRWSEKEDREIEEVRQYIRELPEFPDIVIEGRSLAAIVEDTTGEIDNFILIAQRVALENRLDLQNARAALYDAWRQLAVTANRLQGTLNIQGSNQTFTPPGVLNPFGFDSRSNQFQISINGELPLVRLAERNQFATARVNYQRAQRALMQQEDQVKLSIRQLVRSLTQARVQYEIVKLQLELNVRNIDATIERIYAPPQPGGVGADQIAQTNNLLQQQNILLGSQNALIDLWVQYQQSRLALYRDLGTMPYDEWEAYNEFFAPGRDSARAESPPGDGGPLPNPGGLRNGVGLRTAPATDLPPADFELGLAGSQALRP